MHNNIAKIRLNNGIRIVTEEIPAVRSVAIGIWVGAGSRHECEKNKGITHFIEHLLFKGTSNRSASDIAESLESVGGQLNAFTSKEITCYYAKVLDEHFDLAVDVLSDMFFNSLFAEKAINKERGVVEEEIKMYEDTPDELIHDVFVQTVWPNHPLGRPILGTVESLSKITREDIITYIRDNYIPERIVIAVAGNIKHTDVQDKLRPLFEGMKNEAGTAIDISTPHHTKPNVSNLYRETGQVQICLGTKGLSQIDERIYSIYILNSILGGGSSSRLVQSIREERGLAYSVYSYHAAFHDTGLFTFYAGTSPTKYDEVIDLIIRETSSIVKDGINSRELERTKEHLKGNLYLGLESVGSRMTRLGRTELSMGKTLTADQVVEKLSAVTREDVQEIAKELFAEGDFNLSTIGPLKEQVNIESYLKQLLS